MNSEGPLSLVEEVTEYHSLQAVAWSSPVAFNQAYSVSRELKGKQENVQVGW